MYLDVGGSLTNREILLSAARLVKDHPYDPSMTVSEFLEHLSDTDEFFYEPGELEIRIKEIEEKLKQLNKNSYRIYISGKLTAIVQSEDEAWKELGKRPVFAPYEVRDCNGKILDQFIPF